MIAIMVGLGAAIIGGISYLAVSKKSSPMLRLAALVALAMIIITVIICLVVAFAAPAPKQMPLPDNSILTDAPAASGSTALVFFIVFLVALFLVILLLSLREQRRARQKANGKTP